MRTSSQHILFIATEYESGMRPYARMIILTMWQPGDHVIVVAKDNQVKHDLDALPDDCVTWIDYPATKGGKALFRLYPKPLIKAIDTVLQSHPMKLIYSLTGELVLASHIRRLQRRLPVLYTVHDAIHHDSHYESITSMLKEKVIVEWPQRRLLKATPLKITNSHEQLAHLQRSYPGHSHYYAPFPSLVTDGIRQGGMRVPELESIPRGYILFFGNVQLYKGVHLLYEAYRSRPELHSRALVIAGSGYIYFKRHGADDGVTFINRFIDDRELNDLFTGASVVVYPYISATQSGVTSIASYFDKPMVLSDLPFFKDTCSDCRGVQFFTHGDVPSLASALNRALQSSTGTSELYDRVYSPQAMREALNHVIAGIIDHSV